MRWPRPLSILPGMRSGGRKKKSVWCSDGLRERFVSLAGSCHWPRWMLARTLRIERASLERWTRRREEMPRMGPKHGRPEAIPPHARWRIRRCYTEHYGQWGPEVLRHWAIREGLGSWSSGTIARAIEDLVPVEEVKEKPKRYEITAPMAMWSEDGTAFSERGRKKELLVLQDECARFKINWRLTSGPAGAEAVAGYLREAFEAHGAPLVLKHDGGAIFHEKQVKEVLERYGIIELTSPPGYPPFNGKQERSMRDIKSYERALRRHGGGRNLRERIDMTMRDLNEERPRPVLGGKTAREVMEDCRTILPERGRLRMEVLTRQADLEAEAGSRKEHRAARRKAVVEVLMRYNLLNWGGGVSTDYQRQCGTK